MRLEGAPEAWGGPITGGPCAWGSGQRARRCHAPVLAALRVSCPVPGAAGSGSVGPAPPSPVLSALSVSCPVPFQLLPWPLATAASTAPRQCPPGQEPNVVSSPCPSASPGKTVKGWGRDSGLASGSVLTLSLLQEPGRGTLCRSCPPGTFSASWGSRPCQPHSHCSSRGRLEAQGGTAMQDALCGDCQPG